MTAVAPTGPHLLLIGGKDSGFASIAELAIRVTLIQERKNLSARQTGHATNLVVVEQLTPAAITAVARALHTVDPFTAVLSFYEPYLQVASEIGATLGIAHNPVDAVRVTRDKVAMRALLAARGLPTVRYTSCTSVDDVAAFRAEVDGPVILKPTDGSGSRGVVKLDAGVDVDAAWAWCVAGGSGAGIAEEFVEGQEYSIESLTLDGRHEVLAVTAKLTSGAPSFIEVGHHLPAPIDEATRKLLDETVLGLLDAIGHRWGPAHTEIVVTDTGQPVIIETQTRFGGDQIWEMTQAVTGAALAAETAAGILGLPAPDRRPCAGGAAIRFFAHESVHVTAIGDVEAARAMPGVVRIEMRATPGARVGRLTSSWSRQGYVLAYGSDVAEAITRATTAKAAVGMVVEPVSAAP